MSTSKSTNTDPPRPDGFPELTEEERRHYERFVFDDQVPDADLDAAWRASMACAQMIRLPQIFANKGIVLPAPEMPLVFASPPKPGGAPN